MIACLNQAAPEDLILFLTSAGVFGPAAGSHAAHHLERKQRLTPCCSGRGPDSGNQYGRKHISQTQGRVSWPNWPIRHPVINLIVSRCGGRSTGQHRIPDLLFADSSTF